MRASALVLLLVLVACAGSTPTTALYLLPAAVPQGITRLDPPVRIGLGRIEVAKYLDQPGLVVETEARQVRPARNHEWAEPLEDGLRRFLRAKVSAALGFDVSADTTQRPRWDYAVDLGVERLHGTLSGEAVLVARWRVTPASGKEEGATYQFSASRPLAREGYAGLVDAEIELAGELAVAIAESLRKVTGR